MPDDAFIVHVGGLRRRPGSRRRELRAGFIDPYGGAAPPGPGDSTVPAGSAVTCDVVVESFIGGVMVTGTVTVPWRGVCRRCMAEVGGELHVAVRERFTDEGPSRADEEACAIVDDVVDLEPMAHDAVVLELPMAPLCREDCRGLCRWCGTNLNESTCECITPPDPRWATLEVLRDVPGTESSGHARQRR